MPATSAECTTVFVKKGGPLFKPPPPDVLDHLKAGCPHLVKDRAWLVIFYSIVLSKVSSTEPSNEPKKAKIKHNLWLAFNDVRLLLEPSELNIQALLLLATHVEDFTSPSLCWMLIANACRMLQALGISQRHLDTETRERRKMLFWHLNAIEKHLALIFGRPPTFHRAMANEIPLPTLKQLLPIRPHCATSDAPSTFGAHFIYQLCLVTRVMGDAWHCIYEQDRNVRNITSMIESVDAWHAQATKVICYRIASQV